VSGEPIAAKAEAPPTPSRPRGSVFLRSPAVLLGCAVASGAVFGAHLGGLIFFLNPNLPFRPLPVLRVTGLYAVLVGTATLVLQLPLLIGRPRRLRRFLPWTLTLALAAAALVDGIHASYYAYYLPPGINERLLKAALWLSAGALIAFYTALLHTLERRRYGPRSRWGFLVIVVLSFLAVIERREAFHPPVEATPRPARAEVRGHPQLWVVGVDTATLDAILPLAGEGRLPFFSRMLSGGAHGRLNSFSPNHREALWATVATGRYPWRHGVRGGWVWNADWIAPQAELRLLPVGFGFWRWGIPGVEGRRTFRYRREALALWEFLPRLGMSSAVVGWPASTPASQAASFAISDSFFAEGAEDDAAWPPDVASDAKRYEPDSREVQVSLGGTFGAAPPTPVIDALTGDRWRESLTTSLLDRHPEVSGVFLVLPGLRHVSRRYYGGYFATQFDNSKARDAREAASWIEAYYRQIDQVLSQIWESGKGPRVLALVSAYGVSGSAGWRRLLGLVSRSTALEGYFADSPDGTLLLYGEGIQPGALLTDASLVDIAPTLTYALGLPVARDLDGAVLTGAFDKRFLAQHPLTFLPTYEGLTPRRASVRAAVTPRAPQTSGQ
jgi:hypothetical protein